jgi:type II secretory pathway pseudopilin PulG
MLVELLVAMTLMSVVGVLVLDAVVGGFRGQKQLQDRAQALADVRTAAQRVTRDIRQADPVLGASALSLSVQHSLAGGGSLARSWTLVTVGAVTSLVQDQVTTSAAGVVSPSVRSTVISGLDPATAPFSYSPLPQWSAPAGSPVDPATCAIAATSPVSYARDCIGTVSLHLVRLVPGHGPIPVDTTVDLRNSG